MFSRSWWCFGDAVRWGLLQASAHLQYVRWAQLVLAIVINLLLLWAYDASPDELPYTLGAIVNQSAPILPADVGNSFSYTTRSPWVDPVIRALGAVLVVLGTVFVFLHWTNSTVMILHGRCG